MIFQPAEEGGAGAKAMVDDGMIDRFGIAEVYGMHNYPGMPVGAFGIRAGPMMAAADSITIDIEGVGGHAARPHLGIDTVLVAAQIINNIQSVVSRNVDPVKSAVVSIIMFTAGNTDNVIPQTVQLRGTARSLDADVRELIGQRLHEMVEGTAAAYGAKAKLTYRRGYPVLVNHEREADFAAAMAREIAGDNHVDTALPPMMGAEDFSFMLNERPGAFIWVGNGDSAGLHHPAYNFNDDVIPVGTSYWVKLVETALQLRFPLHRASRRRRKALLHQLALLRRRCDLTAGDVRRPARRHRQQLGTRASSARQVANSLSCCARSRRARRPRRTAGSGSPAPPRRC